MQQCISNVSERQKLTKKFRSILDPLKKGLFLEIVIHTLPRDHLLSTFRKCSFSKFYQSCRVKAKGAFELMLQHFWHNPDSKEIQHHQHHHHRQHHHHQHHHYGHDGRDGPNISDANFSVAGHEGIFFDGGQYLSHLDITLLVLKSIIILTIIAFSVINNVLVIISVVLFRRLRHVNNYFLVMLQILLPENLTSNQYIRWVLRLLTSLWRCLLWLSR